MASQLQLQEAEEDLESMLKDSSSSQINIPQTNKTVDEQNASLMSTGSNQSFKILPASSKP